MTKALGLPFEEQDWGIVNANGSRLEEFIKFYDTHSDYSSFQKYELCELIMASANERLIQGSLGDEFWKFLSENSDACRAQISYWKGLSDELEFPLGEHLRERL